MMKRKEGKSGSNLTNNAANINGNIYGSEMQSFLKIYKADFIDVL
jgi:hypothetical protein